MRSINLPPRWGYPLINSPRRLSEQLTPDHNFSKFTKDVRNRFVAELRQFFLREVNQAMW